MQAIADANPMWDALTDAEHLEIAASLSARARAHDEAGRWEHGAELRKISRAHYAAGSHTAAARF
jgi:hypothetical protein